MFNMARLSICTVIALMHGSVSAQELNDPASDLEIGEVISAAGDDGEVLLQRAGASLSVSDGAALRDGDRILTGQGGSVKLVAHGCERTLEPLSMVTVDADFCRAGIKSVQNARDGRVQLPGSGKTIGGVSPAVAAITTVVAVGGVLAVSNSDGKGSPISQ
jgi:hypothetical protein